MDLEIFNLPDSSGRMSKESFLFKNHKDEYDYIVEYCEINNLLGITFKEKVYLTLNELKSVPVCKNQNCNSRVNFKSSTIGYLDYCSIKCISSDPNIIKLKEENSLKKFGTKSPAQSKVVKDKAMKTNQKKYGYNSAMCLIETQEKSKQTLLKNYGVDNPNKSPEILERRIESFKLSNYKDTYKKTSLERYGVEHPWMNKEVHSKTIDFFYASYKGRIESKIDINKFKFIGFQRGISTSLLFHCSECDKDFDILTYQFYYRINGGNSICINCFPISENASISQIELYNFIVKNYNGEAILDCKNIINPYEIDIYLPELKLGFEFNGVWWHSEKFKGENYHLKKYESSELNDIKLITIWEDDWVTNREICESFILNKLGKTQNKIYARKCEIKEISYNDSKNFLDSNHLQGDCKSSIRIGLFNNNELVSLMAFSKLRLPLQRHEKNRNKDKHYELTRFCNRINSNVVGGASRLMKYFTNKYSPIQVETYSDNLISNGGLYETLGFKYSHTSKPGYWYVVDGIREHRFNWRKQRLVKMGYDINKTEGEIMSELGYYRIYNGGNKKWIFKSQ
jgi:hypothetical protein